jgi:hypothetical protein
MQEVQNKPIQLTRLFASPPGGWSRPLVQPPTNGARTYSQAVTYLFVLQPIFAQTACLLIERCPLFGIGQPPLEPCGAVASQSFTWGNGRWWDKHSANGFPLARNETVQMLN